MNIKHAKIILALLIAALTLALCGCSGGDIQPPAETDATRQPVRTLSCITADALSGMCPAAGRTLPCAGRITRRALPRFGLQIRLMTQ